MLTFAKFANALIDATKQPGDVLVNWLLECVSSQLNHLKNTSVDRGTCSRLLNGARDVAQNIQRGSGEQKVIDGAERYFNERFVKPKAIIPSLLDDFLDGMKKAIAIDSTISDTKKADLLSLADEKTLAKFLAGVCLYVINKPNVIQMTHLNNLPKKNENFSGRVEQLEDIDRLLKKDKKDAVSICHTVSGLGGVGKTQLALEYAHRYHSSYKSCIWFVIAESSTTAEKDFRDFAERFNLVLPPDYKSEDLQRAVKTWLSENRNWLVIFDNLETIETVAPYLPDNKNGRIIITTRNARIGYGSPLKLDVFDLSESIAFMRKRFSVDENLKMEHYKFDDFEDQAPKLVERLGNLPLALEQAAAYIKNMQYRISDYLKLLGESSVDAFRDEDAKALYYERIVSNTWKISFEALSTSAQYMMHLCAYMAPDRIPISFFVDMHEKLPSPLREEISKELTRNRIVADMKSYSLVSGDDVYLINIHRLVQEVIRKTHEEGENQLA